jgi:hypothetical protein
MKPGLYDNINAKRKRIAAGSGETMRKPGSKGAPTKDAFVQSAKTASSGDRSVKSYGDMIKKVAGGKPVKKARGGAGKVRKGMMSPSGDILQVVKPKKNMM